MRKQIGNTVRNRIIVSLPFLPKEERKSNNRNVITFFKIFKTFYKRTMNKLQNRVEIFLK